MEAMSHDQARKIMVKNFFGVEEARKFFGIQPTQGQLAVLSAIPFSKSTLLQLKDVYVLTAVFPLSILAIRARAEQLFYENGWYQEQPFAVEPNQVGWKLVRKNVAIGSTSKSWDEQQAVLGNNDEVPAIQVMVYAIIAHCLATGKRLFRNIYARTASLAPDGFRIDVHFNDKGLSVSEWGNHSALDVGIASARKPDIV